MFKHLLLAISFLSTSVFAANNIIPSGNNNSMLYYKIGGASDYGSPPVPDTSSINLGAGANLGLGQQCGMFNPALAIQNTMNDLQDSVNNLEQSIITSATGSIAEMPMYFLAQANPTMYNLLNNALIGAHTQIDASLKSCQQIKDQIAHGKNPYQDWGTISIGDSWKKHLSLTATGEEDINQAQKTIVEHGGDDGVAWVQGTKSSMDNSLRAGGKGQPPIRVISDTVKAGYNAMLNRDLTSDDPAPSNSGLSNQFASPKDAVNWITNVLGDQTITTCTDSSCTNSQGGLAGRGLLPWATVCTSQNQADCVDTIRTKLQNLVSGQTPATKDNLMAISANDLVISPQVISTLKGMDSSQQGIYTNKLAQEVAMQRLMDKAFTARDILQTGSQVPVIATNRPAQELLKQATAQLDSNIHGVSFESQIRKQMMSDTVASLLDYSNAQQQQAFDVGKVTNQQPMMDDSAVPSKTGASKK